MTGPGADWGNPTLYRSGQDVEPRMFTEADPISSVLVADWTDATMSAALQSAQWGTTTLSGTRRATRRAARHARGSGDGAAVESDVVDRPGAAGRAAVSTVDPAVDPAVDPTVDAAVDPTVDGAADPAVDIVADPLVDVAADDERTTRRLLAASGSMALGSLASRVTGFVRTVLLVAALGTAGVGTAYNSGNNFPNMIYELLLGGVLSSVLIPLLVKAQSEDEDEGVAYTQRLLSLATVALGVVTLLAVLAAPGIAAVFAPAGPQRALTGLFATLLLPEIFFYGLGAMFMAVLNIRQVYAPGAWSPLLNNVVVIATVAVFWALPGPTTLDPRTMTTTQVLVVGIGTTLGIAAQAFALVPSLRRTGFRWRWRFRAQPHESGRLREIGTLAGWVLGYVLVSQVGVTVIQYVGNHDGGFTYFTNADLLFQMPYGILVVSLLTAIMPRMSRAAVRGDDAQVVADLSLGARLSVLAMIPVTAILIALGSTIGVALFAHGRTSTAQAHLIGTSLAWSAFGLFPFALVMLQLRVFYAMRNGRTPTVINVFMVAVKVALVLVTNVVLAAPAGTNVFRHPPESAVEWLNIATSVSYVVGAVVGHVVLTRRLGRLGFRQVARTGLIVAIPSAVGGAAAYAVVLGLRHVLTGVEVQAWAGLVLGGGLGLAIIGLGCSRLAEVRGLLHRDSSAAA